MREVVRRSGVGAAGVVSLALLLAPSAGAEPSSWLDWSAPAECQDTPEVERRLESLLGHAVDFATVPATRVQLGWSVERAWSVRVTVQLAAGPRDRSLDAPSCADAFDLIALSLALILDPDFQASSAEAAGGGSAGEQTSAGGDADTGAAPPLLVAGLGLPIAPGAAPGPEPAGADAPGGGSPRGGERRATLIMAGGALTDLSMFPVPQFGAALQLALGAGAFRIELEGDLLASESTRLRGAEYPVSFHSLFGSARACHVSAWTPRLGWVLCAGGQLGSLGTRERGGEEHRADGAWLAAEASTGPELAATDWLRAFARVRAVSPLIRHEFLLSEGSRVHVLPWLSPQLEVGVSVDVTDLGRRGH